MKALGNSLSAQQDNGRHQFILPLRPGHLRRSVFEVSNRNIFLDSQPQPIIISKDIKSGFGGPFPLELVVIWWIFQSMAALLMLPLALPMALQSTMSNITLRRFSGRHTIQSS